MADIQLGRDRTHAQHVILSLVSFIVRLLGAGRSERLFCQYLFRNGRGDRRDTGSPGRPIRPWQQRGIGRGTDRQLDQRRNAIDGWRSRRDW